jgi:hypothetical protein
MSGTGGTLSGGSLGGGSGGRAGADRGGQGPAGRDPQGGANSGATAGGDGGIASAGTGGGTAGSAQGGNAATAGSTGGTAGNAVAGSATDGGAGDGAAGEGNAGMPNLTPPLVFTRQSTPLDRELASLATNGDVIVAAGGSSLIFSDDGVTWEDADHPAYFVAYGNGTFVAVGVFGEVFLSTDGRTWTQTMMDIPGAEDLSFRTVSYGFGRFFATSTRLDPGVYLTTTNGTSWTSVAVQPPEIAATWRNVEETMAAGDLVIMSSALDGNYVTRDGDTWEQLPNWFSMVYDVTYGGDAYCLGGAMLPSLWSADGETWTRSMNGLPSNGVAYHAGAYYAVSIEGGVYASEDCLEWVPGAEPALPRYFGNFPFDLYAIRVHKDRLVIAGRNGAIYTAP